MYLWVTVPPALSFASGWEYQFVPDLCQPQLITCQIFTVHQWHWHKLEDAKVDEATSVTTIFLQTFLSCGICSINNSIYWQQTGSTGNDFCVSPLFPWIWPLIPLSHWNCKVLGAKIRYSEFIQIFACWFIDWNRVLAATATKTSLIKVLLLRNWSSIFFAFSSLP